MVNNALSNACRVISSVSKNYKVRVLVNVRCSKRRVQLYVDNNEQIFEHLLRS